MKPFEKPEIDVVIIADEITNQDNVGGGDNSSLIPDVPSVVD